MKKVNTKATRGKHNALKLAYVAGWMDGEGSIYISKIKNVRSGNYLYVLGVSTSNTDKEIIDWFEKEFGAYRTALGYKIRKHPNHQLAYQWFSSSKTACEFLKILVPYLKIKKKQAKLAIAFQEKKSKAKMERKGQKLTEKEYKWRDKCYQEMQKLNHSKYYLQPQRLSEETSKRNR